MTSKADRERVEKKREHFVNLYRANWGTNQGLDTEKIRGFNEATLDRLISSQQAFGELQAKSGRRTGVYNPLEW
jgi:hypothetical protein